MIEWPTISIDQHNHSYERNNNSTGKGMLELFNWRTRFEKKSELIIIEN